jgi:hypothetical protein
VSETTTHTGAVEAVTIVTGIAYTAVVSRYVAANSVDVTTSVAIHTLVNIWNTTLLCSDDSELLNRFSQILHGEVFCHYFIVKIS